MELYICQILEVLLRKSANILIQRIVMDYKRQKWTSMFYLLERGFSYRSLNINGITYLITIIPTYDNNW